MSFFSHKGTCNFCDEYGRVWTCKVCGEDHCGACFVVYADDGNGHYK